MFWKRFWEECDRRGLTPNHAGRLIGVSSGTITAWKQGTIPQGRTLNQVASFFGVSSDYLLGNTDERLMTDRQLEGVEFALHGEIEDLSMFSEAEKQDILDYIKFKKIKKELTK